MIQIEVNQVNKNVSNGKIPITISLDSISHYKPYVNDQDVWEGSMIYLKNNKNPIKTDMSYEQLSILININKDFTPHLLKLNRDNRVAALSLIREKFRI